MGFISEIEYQLAKKFGGSGPGGCRGKEECESYCSNPVNQEECINFAKSKGFDVESSEGIPSEISPPEIPSESA